VAEPNVLVGIGGLSERLSRSRKDWNKLTMSENDGRRRHLHANGDEMEVVEEVAERTRGGGNGSIRAIASLARHSSFNTSRPLRAGPSESASMAKGRSFRSDDEEEEERVEYRPINPPESQQLEEGGIVNEDQGVSTTTKNGRMLRLEDDTNGSSVATSINSTSPARRISSSRHPSEPLTVALGLSVNSESDDEPIIIDQPLSSGPVSARSGLDSAALPKSQISSVEIPFMPLHKIRQYSHPSRSSQPTLVSRRGLINDPISIASSSRGSSMPPRPVRAAAKAGPSWRVHSTPHTEGDSDEFGGYGTEDEIDDDEEEGLESESESDGMTLRRSVRRPRVEPEMRRSTRVAKRSVSLLIP